MGLVYKECPFCGNDEDDLKAPIAMHRGFVVLCGNCFAMSGPGMNIEHAQKTWNRRYNDKSRKEPV